MSAARHEAAPPPPSARDEKRARTRQALIDAALTLFAAKGYDATSTEEIAEWAGVSPRTFFRYFETKDRVLFFGGDDFNAAVVRHLPEQPAELDELAALERTMVDLAPSLHALKRRIGLFHKALGTSPALLGQHTAASERHDAAVAVALAARRGLTAPDGRCVMAASLASVAFRQALGEWLSSRRDLSRLVTERFELLRQVADAGNGAPPTAAAGRPTRSRTTKAASRTTPRGGRVGSRAER